MNRSNLLRGLLAAALLFPAAGCKHAQQRPPPQPALPTTPDAPFRAKQPAPSGELHFTPPTPETLKLKNGLQVYVIERHELPLVTVGLLVRSGRDADPADKQGLAGFTADMLDEGAKGMGAPQIAASFEDQAIQYSADVMQNASFIRFSALAPNLEQALDIWSAVLLKPTFAEKDLERVRGERLASLTAAHDDPSEVARDVLLRSLYGDKNPMGAPSTGTPEGIKAIKQSDLKKFHDTYYVPSNAALVVVGDVKAAELKPLLEKHLGAWRDRKVKAPKLAAPTPPSARQVLLVDKPGAPQSQIWVGQLEPSAKDPDRETFTIMNDIFGGLFSSRVNLALREGTGWSYGVYSFPMWNKHDSVWACAGGYVADKTSDALAKLVQLLDKMHQGDVSDQELAAARDAEIRSLAGYFESNPSTADAMARLVALDLPVDYYSTVEKKYEAVTAADVKRVAQARLQPDKMTIVVVGPKAQEQQKLTSLNVGKLELRDEAGKAIKQ